MTPPDPSTKPVVTRFAPSPTGALHVGGLRTALFNWAFARQNGGVFILRMEDTDRARSSESSARSILADLRWAGLDWNEGPACPADWQSILRTDFDVYAEQLDPRHVGPFYQSQRMEQGIYNRFIDALLSAGRAYEDNGAIRFRMPPHDIVVNDQVLGEVRVPAGQTEAFVIRKQDGYPTYHFAVVVDDALMGVTHVIRGQEHLSNAPKHVGLYQALREVTADAALFAEPAYAHIPLIFNLDGSKMSKRDKAKAARKAAELVEESSIFERITQLHGLEIDRSSLVTEQRVADFLAKKIDDVELAEMLSAALGYPLPEIDVSDFRKSGYLPAVLCNYLALLGWNPGENIEKFDNDFLVKHFSLNRVQKGSAKFDREKLASFNADALAALPPDQLARAVWSLPINSALLDNCGLFTSPDDPKFRKFIELYRPRSKTLRDPIEQGRFFLASDDAIDYDWDEKNVSKAMVKNDWEGLAALRSLVIDQVLENIPDADWLAPRIESAVKIWAESRSLPLGKVAQPLRVAVSGGVVSPPIFETLELLGRGSVLLRIDRCIASAEVKRIGTHPDHESLDIGL